MKIDPNSPAMPTTEQDGLNPNFYNTVAGLTIRQEFAKAAMQGLLANQDWVETANIPDDWDDYKHRLTSGAVEMADALIEALNKEKS